MDSKVSARIPMETRDRGNAALAAIGATTTQLIQAAYDYLIETGDLPHPAHDQAARGEHPTEEQKARARQVLRATTCKVPASFFAGKTDDDLLEEALREQYEALA